jgi:hypothetical protein
LDLNTAGEKLNHATTKENQMGKDEITFEASVDYKCIYCEQPIHGIAVYPVFSRGTQSQMSAYYHVDCARKKLTSAIRNGVCHFSKKRYTTGTSIYEFEMNTSSSRKFRILKDQFDRLINRPIEQLWHDVIISPRGLTNIKAIPPDIAALYQITEKIQQRIEKQNKRAQVIEQMLKIDKQTLIDSIEKGSDFYCYRTINLIGWYFRVAKNLFRFETKNKDSGYYNVDKPTTPPWEQISSINISHQSDDLKQVIKHFNQLIDPSDISITTIVKALAHSRKLDGRNLNNAAAVLLVDNDETIRDIAKHYINENRK